MIRILYDEHVEQPTHPDREHLLLKTMSSEIFIRFSQLINFVWFSVTRVTHECDLQVAKELWIFSTFLLLYYYIKKEYPASNYQVDLIPFHAIIYLQNPHIANYRSKSMIHHFKQFINNSTVFSFLLSQKKRAYARLLR